LPALRRHSPEPEPGRKRRHGLTAAARRQLPRPNHRRASVTGKPNRPPVPLEHLLRPPYTAGELPPPPEGLVVNIEGMVVNPGT
jgi:hypothetical protein